MGEKYITEQGQAIEIAELEQAIEYFQNELSSINVFSELISFKEEEKRSIETALKVLKKVKEEMAAGNMCDVAQEST